MEPFRQSPILTARRLNAGRSRRNIYTASVCIHVVVMTAIFLLVPEKAKEEEVDRRPINMVFHQPEPEPVPPPQIPELKALPPPPAPKPKPKVKPVEPPVVSKVEPPVVSKVEPPVVSKVEPPKVELPPEPVVEKPAPKVVERVPEPPPAPKPVAKPEPPKPKPVVKTNVFAEEQAVKQAPAPVQRAAKLGEFGTSLEDKPAPRRTVQAVEKVGGFEVKEEERRAGTPSGTVVKNGGFGDSVAAKEPGRPGPRGTVTTAGFGETENAPAAKPRSLGTISAGGFNQQIPLEASKPRPRVRQPETIDTSVEIVSKPKPVYTDEARSLKVEGEVVLEVTFVASGVLRVLRVVSSLGHGLDEAAIAAAKKIQFTPARRDGVAVDYTATLRVVFRLA